VKFIAKLCHHNISQNVLERWRTIVIRDVHNRND